MAKFYSKTKSNYGSLTGSIIVWPIELPSTNPSNPDNVKVLPAGYLRCDGSKYNASDYPDLAVICGTGVNSKFVRRDQNNLVLTVLSDQEFVVPDLGSKYPRPTTGASAGEYNNILTPTQAGLYTKRSGMGLEASSNVGNIATVSYSGKFNIPSQQINITGKPSWTWGTSGYTDQESVDSSAIHPHMHFSTTTRVRIKAINTPANGQDLAASTNSYNTASTINITDWLNATKYSDGGLSNSGAGSNQPACWAIASGTKYNRGDIISIVPLPPPLLLGSQLTAYTNFCRTGCSLSDLRCYCLNANDLTYSLQNEWYGFPGTRTFIYIDSLIGCVPNAFDGGVEGSAWQTDGTATAQFSTGSSGVQNDWAGVNLSDVLPFNSNFTANATGYAQAHNIYSEVNEIVYAPGVTDPTIHNHKIIFDKNTHTYKIETNPFLLEPDGLTTTINLFPTTVASLDAVTSPYIMLEYLIKT